MCTQLAISKMSNENRITNIFNHFITIDTVLDFSRTDCNYSTPFESNIYNYKREDTDITRETSCTSLPTLIYRFKFTEDFMEELYKFSKIHQYDERKDFKEAWKLWTEENQDIINDETIRLSNLGYEGDVVDKMFKSARYYFRKKSSEKKTPRQRRKYFKVNRELLDAMDRHIEENIFKIDYQPKTGFISFCKTNELILKQSIAKIFEQGVKDSQLIQDQIKKTYKNRHFVLTHNK